MEEYKISKCNPFMDKILKRIGELHDKKNSDYSVLGNPYSNFEAAAITAGVSVDEVFRVMIGIKLARLDALSKKDNKANFESVEDTILDLAVYACIYMSYKDKEKQNEVND